jgi:hypothetical protein
MILVAAHDAAATADEKGDDGTNDLLVSDVKGRLTSRPCRVWAARAL